MLHLLPVNTISLSTQLASPSTVFVCRVNRVDMFGVAERLMISTAHTFVWLPLCDVFTSYRYPIITWRAKRAWYLTCGISSLNDDVF